MFCNELSADQKCSMGVKMLCICKNAILSFIEVQKTFRKTLTHAHIHTKEHYFGVRFIF